MAGLSADIKDHAGIRRVALRGAIDDYVEVEKFVRTVQAPAITFDFEKIDAINSNGIKAWVNIIKGLPGAKITYENCPTFFVDAINMIPVMAKGVRIQSFYLPYACRSCDIEKPILVTQEQFKAKDFLTSLNKLYPCTSCERHLEFQDDESVYFDFVAA